MISFADVFNYNMLRDTVKLWNEFSIFSSMMLV